MFFVPACSFARVISTASSSMQLRSFPNFFRADQPTRMPSDSPFPPLKVQHRYKGVYERAGFDVNLGSPDATSPGLKTLLPKISPPNGNSPFPRPAHRDPSSASLPRSYKVSPSKNSSSSLPDNGPRSAPLTTLPPVDRRCERLVSDNGHPSAHNPAPVDTRRHVLDSRAPAVDSRPEAPRPAQYQPFQSFQPSRPHRGPDDDRNKKNLTLHLAHSNFAEQHLSAETYSGATSPTFDDSPADRNTPNTSANSSGDFGRKNSASSAMSVQTTELTQPTPYPAHDYAERDLSSVLDDFKNDVEHHKRYDPRGAAKANAKAAPASYDAFVPSAGKSASSFNRLAAEDLNDSSQDDGSFRFGSPPNSADTADTTNEEFEAFLQTSAADRSMARHSQLSTISSIISKPTHSDDEDCEIERELERQLESLKTGSDLSLPSRSQEDDSFTTAMSGHTTEDSLLPTFKISEAGTQEDDDSDTETEGESKEGAQNVAPLAFGRAETFAVPETPAIGHPNESTYETPETIKPLSPKNHRVEEELNDINFKYDEAAFAGQDVRETDQSGFGAQLPSEAALANEEYSVEPVPEREELDVDSDDSEYRRDLFKNGVARQLFLVEPEDSDENILLQNPTPSDFSAFPKSVIATNFPSFRTSGVSKCPPGEGACRSCNGPIDPGAKGMQKAVYSKTGELSGQWHRGCFSCAYNGCSIQFSKKVICYALLDNAFCHHHYHSLNGTLCQTCHLGIEGECIENELKQKWHVACLKCSHCDRNINKDYFLVDGAIVCEDDAPTVIRRMEQLGMTTMNKVEKRRTRMLFLDQL